MSKRQTLKQILPLLQGEEGERRLARFWSHVDRRGPDDCWEWQSARKSDGYGRFTLVTGKPAVASRVALISTAQDEPANMIVLHKCDNPPCCNPAHLYFGTLRDNANDMHQRGRGPNSGAKLSEEQLALVVLRLKAGLANNEIAAEFAVSVETISQIRNGRIWGPATAAMGWKPMPRKGGRPSTRAT